MFTSLALGQNLTQTIRGTIIDTDSKLPIVGAGVSIMGTSPIVGTVTDLNGNFRLENIPIGRIALEISYMGYETKTIPNIEVNSGKEVVMNIIIQESVVKLDEVVVKANKKKGEAINDMSLLSSRSISLEETKRYTGGMDDPARVVTSFAGVVNSPDGSSDIIVRGNSPKYMQWRLDGLEIASPYHLNDQNSSFGALTALNNNLLGTSDFYTGAFSAEYGDVLSNVMDVKLRNGNNERFEATCGIGIMGADLTLEGPFKKGYSGSYLVNYRYNAISLLKKLKIIDIDGVVDFQNATFKVVLPTKKAGTFSFFGLGGLDGISMTNITPDGITTPGRTADASISKDYDKDTYLLNFGLNHTLTINNNSFIKTSLYYSGTGFNDDVYKSDIIRMYDLQGIFVRDTVVNKQSIFNSRIDNSAYRGAIIYNNKINSKNKIQIGTKYTLLQFNYNQNMLNDQGSALENVTDFNENISTINNFISWKFSINDKITFVSGLHNMNVLYNSKSTIEPRIALNWKLGSKSSIHAGYGKHSTMESVHNYFTRITQEDGSVMEPNKDLDLLKADHFVIGYEKRFTENLMAKVEVYYQNLYNLPVENNDTSYYATINEGYDYRYVELVNKGTGKNYGVEFTLERFFDNKFYFLVNGSVFNSTYKTLEGIERNTMYNGNYLFNVLFGKEFKNFGAKKNKTLAINAKAFFGGGRRYIPLLRDEQGNVAVDPAKNRYWDYQKAYDNKLDNIFYMNLSVSYKINKAKSTHEIFVDLMNLANGNARLSEYYDESKPDKIGYLKQMIFIPNIMYRVYF
jgi:hypothetical protein